MSLSEGKVSAECTLISKLPWWLQSAVDQHQLSLALRNGTTVLLLLLGIVHSSSENTCRPFSVFRVQHRVFCPQRCL